MATKNAIDSNIPIEVTKGGTGAATLTDKGVLVGAGTGAISGLTAGTTGEVLVGVTSGNPAFGSTLTKSGSFIFTDSTAGARRNVQVSNLDNTNVASHASFQIVVGGASGGDAFVDYVVNGVTTWLMGIDNSASDSFKLSKSPSLGTTDTFIMTTAGERTMPLQPAFSAYVSSSITNVTGNSTLYRPIIFDTEVFDQNSDYDNTTGVFTASVTGRYLFTFTITISQATTGTAASLEHRSSNRDYFPNSTDPANNIGANADVTLNGSFIADMDAADTMEFGVRVAGVGADTSDVRGSTGMSTYVQGTLSC